MTQRLIYSALCFLGSLLALPSWAGLPDGPYIVFADLSRDSKVTDTIKSYMDSDRKGLFCDDIARSPLIFLKKRPEGMDNESLSEAILKRNPSAQRKLQDQLVAYRLDPLITQGLDGVVVFVDKPKPAMLSMGVAGSIKSVPLQSAGRKAILAGFCQAIPKIYRN